MSRSASALYCRITCTTMAKGARGRSSVRRSISPDRRHQAIDPTFPFVIPQDLRRTATSLAISAGANPKVQQQMLGHASAVVTLDTYAHLREDDLETVSDPPLRGVLRPLSRPTG